MKDYLQETKKCLEEYKANKDMLEANIKLLKKLKENRKNRVEGETGETGVTGIRYDVIPAKNNKVISKVEEIAIKNAQLELDLEEKIEALSYYVNRIDMALEEIKPVWKEVLILKYLEGNTWEYTERKVGLSDSTCRRYAKVGIKALADKLAGQKSYIDLPLFRDIYLGQVVGE